MALQVWLPLNGDLNNYGCSNLKFSVLASNTASATGGKIGNCYTNNSNTAGGILSDGTIDLTLTQSIFCWFKFTSLMSNSELGGAMGGQHRYKANTGLGLTIKYVSSSTGYLSANTGTGSSRTYNTYCGTTLLQANTWYHVGYTYDGTTFKLYVNGNCEYTGTFTNFSVPADYLYLFAWSFNDATTNAIRANYKLNGSINDFRAYNHCLSPKEIKEISKALVVHYPLSDQYSFGAINKYSTNRSEGDTSSSSWTKTKLANERGYNFKKTYTGTGSNAYYSLGFPTFAFTVDHKYCWSVKVRCNKWTGNVLTMRCARVSNDYASGMVSVTICNTSLADGKWHEYYAISAIPETVVKGSTTYNCAPLMEFYTGNMNGNGTVYDMDFDIKDIQVVESDTYVPYIDNAFAGNTIYDTSGYKNNGTVSGTITPIAETPRYSIATLFTKAGYIANSAFNVVTQQFTTNIWVYPNTASSQHFLYGMFTSWNNDGYGFFRNASSTEYYFRLKSSAESTYLSKSIVTTASAWNMLTIVYTGTQVLLYLNGALANTYTYGSSGTVTLTNLMIGNSKYNSTPASENEEAIVSDFRVYATVLSAADILELYNAPVSINKHSMMTQGEFIEQ